MPSDSLPRKLAAILYADVAAYSRLTGEDEEGTHRQLSQFLDLISSKVEACQGRVVHYAGDAVLADFTSVMTAIDCAVDIQEELADRNTGIPEDRKVQFRIGVNLGDVIVDRDDIYGDGVNIAARLESLAQPGGIYVSGIVYGQIRKRTDLEFEDMGEHTVKNIEEPVHIYAIKTGKFDMPEVSPQKLDTKPAIAVLPACRNVAIIRVLVAIKIEQTNTCHPTHCLASWRPSCMRMLPRIPDSREKTRKAPIDNSPSSSI